ncbi:MAG: DNA mismatch repair endonuclease MutL [Ignavibacteria bacterium]|nr:DNA mismatch repair endonuclease MutL [Ignavibacteria bacterium]
MNTGKIKILPEAVANRIAAGEVVSRPESVVKELIENSIDAGATEITLVIKDAGKSLIQVIDNGIGMVKDDAILCFQRHSTSKIYNFEDLDAIRTLGFRGEALASICSVSQIELKTKTADDEIGTYVRMEGNDLIEVSQVSMDKGTNISVKNLFFNTPARRNFLKSNQTEFKHIYDTFVRFAVSYPEIYFIFYNNDSQIFNLKPSNTLERLKEIFTEEVTNNLIPIHSDNPIISIHGYISKPSFVKKTRDNQYIFLNNRYIINKNINFAIYNSYEHLIEKGNFPSYFVFIDIDPTKVDVNVHPSKLEVKFEDESAIFNFVRNAVKKSLRDSDLTFEIGFDEKQDIFDKTDKIIHKITTSTNKSRINKPFKIIEFEKEISPRDFDNSFNKGTDSEIETEVFPEKQSNIFEHKNKTESEQFTVWQLHNKYIICQTETGLMIIDQHAAHERILYEKAYEMLNSKANFSQQLLIPIQIKLSKIDYQIALNLKEELKSLGFNFNIIDDDTLELVGVPSDVKTGEENKILQELIEQYKEYELKLNLEKRDNIAKSFACKGAIKSGDRLSQQEMLNLIDSLFLTSTPYVCPHGRPTILRINIEEIDKRFNRT